MPRRRTLLVALGGGLLAALPAVRGAGAEASEEVAMRGSARGERVWFAPVGLAVQPGTTLRFVHRDPGNSHTSTAYHPAYGRPLRIPPTARPWDSGWLLPGEGFAVTLDVPGVYDFFCRPHEAVGMVGRIVVGSPATPGFAPASAQADDLPEAALAAFPEVATILARGRVFVEGVP